MFNSRIRKLKRILSQKKLDAFLVSNFFNILYLTGFKGLAPLEREAYVLVTRKGFYLFTDGRYLINVKYQKSVIKNTCLPAGKTHKISNIFKTKLITPEEGLIFHLQKIVGEEKIRTIGFESEDLKFVEYRKIKRGLKIELIPTERLIMKLREIKDKEEIEKIRFAAGLANKCLKDIIPTIKIGMKEKEIAFQIECYLRKIADIAFEPIVAIDANAAIPHYNTKTGCGQVRKNSVILIDFGAKHKDYLSDMTRMIFINPEAAKINIYQKLREVQEKTIREIGINKNPRAIDSFCRQLLQEKNFPNYPHSTGHGIGLEVHEFPKISSLYLGTIEENNVFTIEPGVYFQDKFGMRIEDTVVFRKEKAEVLTKFGKEPVILKR